MTTNAQTALLAAVQNGPPRSMVTSRAVHYKLWLDAQDKADSTATPDNTSQDKPVLKRWNEARATAVSVFFNEEIKIPNKGTWGARNVDGTFFVPRSFPPLAVLSLFQYSSPYFSEWWEVVSVPEFFSDNFPFYTFRARRRSSVSRS